MAHKKSQGATGLGRDSIAKRLGIKLYAGEMAYPGAIIVRQKGTKYHPGSNTDIGSDYTIFSMAAGQVYFYKKRIGKTGQKKVRVFVGVKSAAKNK